MFVPRKNEMPRKNRVVQIEEVENGYVLRIFDADRSSSLYLTLDRMLASVRAYMLKPQEEIIIGGTSQLHPAQQDPQTALERKPEASSDADYRPHNENRGRWQRPTGDKQ